MAGDGSADLTGRRLGNYRIDGVLGRGGMSMMYKATDVRLGRKVALKVIGEHLGADAEFRERFVDEARNTSAIDHANIVPLYDFGELDGMLYIAMRLVDGSDLASLVGGTAMPAERALGLLEQVADALDTLHERGLVHLDVKPANVLVTSRESAREHVYIADFGLTRRGTTGHRTRGGDFLGSPTYAAPEHLRGEPLDGRTDQYALACMLFTCLTGQPPFTGDVQTVIKGHLGSAVPSVSRAAPTLPHALDEVVRRGMAKSPDQRYGNCVELVSAARKALEPHGTSSAGQHGRQPVVVAQHGEGTLVHPYGDRSGDGGGQPGNEQPGSPRPGPQAGHHQPGSPPGPQPGSHQLGPQPGQHQGPHPGMPGPSPQWGGQPGMPGYGTPIPGSHSGAVPPPQQQPHYGTPPQGMLMPPPGPPPGYGPPPQGHGPPPKKRGTPWIVWALTAVIVAGVGVAVVLLLLNGDDTGEDAPPTQTQNSSAPDIPIDPGVSTGNDQPPTGNEPLPTSIPIVPGG